jgi:hypothetical protein
MAPGALQTLPRTITLTTFSFDHSPTACYRGCAIMTGKFMYEPVTQRAATAILPGISRHTKLLETRLTQTKQTTEPSISRHKTATPPYALSPHPCSAEPGFVRHCGVPQSTPCRSVPSEDEFAAARLSGVIPLATDRLSRITGHGSEVTNTPFLIDRPKRLKTAVTQTKQTPEAISNRMKIRGVPQIQSDGKSEGKSHGHSHVARAIHVIRGSWSVYPESRRDEGRVSPEAFEFRPYSNMPAQGAILA